MSEHYTKYETMAQRLGIAELRALVPASAERIKQALDAGDEHLNTIPLASWDAAAMKTSAPEPAPVAHCSTCQCAKARDPRYSRDWPYDALNRTQRYAPWSRRKGLSLAERVCVLKHVARYHLA